MFASTRRWLSASEDHVLTLVVDEMHTYRGTPGTEVSLMVRRLLERLSLGPDSKQIRCIGTSASLEGGEGTAAEFAAGFFSQAESSFNVIPGKPIPLSPPRTLDHKKYKSLAKDVERDPEDPAAAEALRKSVENDAAAEAIASACSADGVSSPRATPVGDLCSKLFGGIGDGRSELRQILGPIG